MDQPQRGRFITFEGGEGTGKSTQLRLLADAMDAIRLPAMSTREPGGAAGAEQIRALLVQGSVDRWDDVTEALLHFAARRDHLVKMVWPTLDQGDWVLCDRFADSTLAYQGYGHGLDLKLIRDLYRLSVGDFAPDLTVILDIAAEQGLERAGRRGGDDRYERMGLAFHQRLRQGFLDIAAAEPGRCVVIDAAGTVDEVHHAVKTALRERLGVPFVVPT